MPLAPEGHNAHITVDKVNVLYIITYSLISSDLFGDQSDLTAGFSNFVPLEIHYPISKNS